MKRVLFAFSVCVLASCATPRATSGGSPGAQATDEAPASAPSDSTRGGSGSGELVPTQSGERPQTVADVQMQMHEFEWWEAGG